MKKKIPGISNGNGKKNGNGISLYGKSNVPVTKGKISDIKIKGLKGDPWKDTGALKRVVGGQ